MRLLRLRLENFRQHAETEILFQPGLTGIIGPNGAGKSTLLEAIAWAIYGHHAARGTNETLRFSRARAGSAVRAELDFRMDHDLYRVSRTLRGADLFLGASLQPIASGLKPVTEVLTRRLGMTREEFFHTYFTEQKELQFLAAMRPAERARFLSQVLGYERLRVAQERVRERRNALAVEVKGLEAALGDPRELEQKAREAEERAQTAETRAAEAETEHARAAKQFEVEEPRWTELERKRERDQAVASDARVAAAEAETAREAVVESVAELETLEAVETQLAEIRRPLERLPAVEREAERWTQLKESETTRVGLARHIKDVTVEVRRRTARIADLEKRAASEPDDARAVAALRKERDDLQKDRDTLRTEWARERQEADTQLRTLGDRARELKKQIESLRDAGPEGVCPTCQRPLRKELDRVLEVLQGQLESVTQDGTWWRKRQRQLEREPEALQEMEKKVADLEKAQDAAEARWTKSQNAGADLERERRERAEREKALANLTSQLDRLPTGYDADRHRAHQEQLNGLRRIQEEVTRLETRLERRPALLARRADAEKRAGEAETRAAKLQAERAALAYSAEELETVRTAFEAARAARHETALRLER
ncbi:MAG: AAA family ATPase, partial [Gemmatimonadota bacterium]